MRTMYQGQAGGRYVWVGGGRGSRSRYVCVSVRGRGMYRYVCESMSMCR